MFQEVNSNQTVEVVKNVFDSHKTLSRLLQDLFRQLRTPAVQNMSFAEFRAMVDNWEQRAKEAANTTPFRW